MRKECFGCRPTADKIGVLLAQLGTPDAPTGKALRPYLKRFLGDPRVIEKPRLLWWLILNGIILNTRPKRSAALYKRIWKKDGSPLKIYTEKQCNKLRERLQQVHPSIEVAYGMRYSDPDLESALDSLIAKGCSKILLFNMYPQYSSTTVATNYDAVFKHLLKRRVVPTLRVVEPYYAHPAYINALATRINESLEALSEKPDKLVFSYHGIPEEYVEKGDVYCCQCTETSAALIPKLQLPAADVIHTYQSRFGKDPWLEPYTDETFERLGESGAKRIAVACPGFTADCLETLDEIGNEGSEEFEEAGGERLDLLPCLNDHPAWIDAMTEIAVEEMGSWLATAKRTSSANRKVACPVKVFKAERKRGEELPKAQTSAQI